MPESESAAPEQLYAWPWRTRLPERKGHLFRLLIRGKTMNSCLIEFVSDNGRCVTSRNALRKVKS
jgi:hypothetical protein